MLPLALFSDVLVRPVLPWLLIATVVNLVLLALELVWHGRGRSGEDGP